MEESPVRKRRLINLTIKKRFQFKYLRLILGTIIAIMFLTAVTLYGTFYLILATAQLGRYAEARLGEVFIWFNWLFLIECLICMAIGGFLSLRLTFKVAGPLYRIEKMIKEVAEKGMPEEIRIRQEDDLQELVEGINKLIKSLSQREQLKENKDNTTGQ